ncbi:MAG: diacylglycerol/lipid kinase family protein [Candidatus Rokuibacteriota bacterium]
MTRRAVIIDNPGSGPSRDRGRRLAGMVEALAARGVDATVWTSAAPRDATSLAREAVMTGAGMVVVHGGDGTVNETLQALVGSRVALGVWPGGTANVLARELGLPRGVDALADVLAAGRTWRVSVGRAGPRYFLLMAGIGLDAAVVQAVRPGLKRLAGEGAYWAAALARMARWRPARFVVEAEGRQYTATFAVIANASSYGGGLRFAPHARMDDDVLDVCLVDSDERLALARYLAAARHGSHLDLPSVTYLRTGCVRAQGGDGAYVQVDGELAGRVPMLFECVPEAISLIVPETRRAMDS